MKEWVIPVRVTAPDELSAEDVTSAMREAVESLDYRLDVVGPDIFRTDALNGLSFEAACDFVQSMKPQEAQEVLN